MSIQVVRSTPTNHIDTIEVEMASTPLFSRRKQMFPYVNIPAWCSLKQQQCLNSYNQVSSSVG
jgi:hypothetical protein